MTDLRDQVCIYAFIVTLRGTGQRVKTFLDTFYLNRWDIRLGGIARNEDITPVFANILPYLRGMIAYPAIRP